MRNSLFKDDETITYFRLKKNRRIAKRISRKDGGSFFAKST